MSIHSSFEDFDNKYEHVLSILGEGASEYSAAELLHLSGVFEKVTSKDDADQLLAQRAKSSCDTMTLSL